MNKNTINKNINIYKNNNNNKKKRIKGKNQEVNEKKRCGWKVIKKCKMAENSPSWREKETTEVRYKYISRTAFYLFFMSFLLFFFFKYRYHVAAYELTMTQEELREMKKEVGESSK